MMNWNVLEIAYDCSLARKSQTLNALIEQHISNLEVA